MRPASGPRSRAGAVFASPRERRLWLSAAAVVGAIYATAGLARTWADALRSEGLLAAAFWVGFLLIVAAIAVQGLRRRPGGLEVGLALGVAGAYLLALLRLAIPEERTHLIEYSAVALLVHAALLERRRAGRRVPAPGLVAIALTVAVGWLDEGGQALLPGRVYDLRDVAFNALAAVLAVGGSGLLAWAHRRADRIRP